MTAFSPMYRSITNYVYDPLILRLDDLAAEDIARDDTLTWTDALEDWRGWELMLDWMGCLDAEVES